MNIDSTGIQLLVTIRGPNPCPICMHSAEHILPGSLLCYIEPVKILSAIGRLLSILAIVGLVVAPIARPAMAMTAVIQSHSADHVVANHGDMAMPEDMPCCPKKAPVPDCSKDCLAICASQLLYNHLSAAALVIPLTLADLLLPANEPGLTGLKQRPPPKPPKT